MRELARVGGGGGGLHVVDEEKPVYISHCQRNISNGSVPSDASHSFPPIGITVAIFKHSENIPKQNESLIKFIIGTEI